MDGTFAGHYTKVRGNVKILFNPEQKFSAAAARREGRFFV
jgi:hypothetical protein